MLVKVALHTTRRERFLFGPPGPAGTICRSFARGPEQPAPRHVRGAARRHRHTLPGAARSPRAALRGTAAAATPPPPLPPAACRPCRRRPRPRSLAAGVRPPTLRGRERPGTQARQLGRAASAAMTASRGSAPRAKARCLQD